MSCPLVSFWQPRAEDPGLQKSLFRGEDNLLGLFIAGKGPQAFNGNPLSIVQSSGDQGFEYIADAEGLLRSTELVRKGIGHASDHSLGEAFRWLWTRSRYTSKSGTSTSYSPSEERRTLGTVSSVIRHLLGL